MLSPLSAAGLALAECCFWDIRGGSFISFTKNLLAGLTWGCPIRERSVDDDDDDDNNSNNNNIIAIHLAEGVLAAHPPLDKVV